jgi:hypothetical protein
MVNLSNLDMASIYGIFNNGIVNITVVSLLVSQIVKSKLKPIENDVKLAKDFMEKHNDILTQLFDNESFCNALERTIENHVLFLGNSNQDARTYIVFIGSLIKSFSNDILQIGITDVKNDTVLSKATHHISLARHKLSELFGIEWAEKYYRKSKKITEKYINDVCHISDDIVNDKQMRFRTITIAYTQKIMSNFVREYFLLDTKIMSGE